MARKKMTPVSSKEREIASQIKSKVEDSIGQTTTWEQNNVKWHKMRMRIKKKKSFPFVGCSNLRMPTIEIKLRKVKAALINYIFGIRPIVQVLPTPSGSMELARKVEKFLDHLLLDVIKIKPTVTIATDQMLEKGFYCLKPYWKTEIITRIEEYSLYDLSLDEAIQVYSLNTSPEMLLEAMITKFNVDMGEKVAKHNRQEIEKAVVQILDGKKKIRLELEDIICDYPDIALCPPEKLFVPADSGVDPQTNSYLVHEFDLPLETVEKNAELKGWDIGEIDDIKYFASKYKDRNATLSSKTIDDTKSLREGITRIVKNNKLKVWEYYGWYDINGDGVDEKCLITIAPDFNKVLRKISLPYYSGKYPLVKFFYELTDDRWFSHRGIPELIEDIVKEIDIQHMQKIDQQTMRNAPMYVHRAGMIAKKSMQFIFGNSMPVHGMQSLSDVIAPINNNNSNVEYSYEREQMILETKVEELIGQVDFSLQSMINKRQPRTLGEVQLQQQNMQQVFSLDAGLFKQSFEELVNWIWELWCQYGDSDYEFKYFGKDMPQGETIKLSREEIQGKYYITLRGNDQNTNPQVRLQKAQMVMMAATNPIALQSGVIKPYHLAQAYKLLYQELDIPNYEGLFESPEQLAKEMQQKMQQPPPPDIKITGKDLAEGEMAQVLQKMGIHPDSRGRMLNAIKDLEGGKNGESKK